MEALGLNLGYLLVQVFNFGILFIVLRAWVYKPLLGLLEKRRTAIAQGLEDARVAAEARNNAEEEARKVIAEAQSTASQKVREATERAEQANRDILAHAEEEANRIREEALVDASQERDKVLADLRSQVSSLAMAAAQKLIGETLNEKMHLKLIDEFFSGIKDKKVLLLEGTTISGKDAEVTSAIPLNADEQDIIKNEIIALLGNQATISFRVEPTILGGLVIRVGDKILDGSLSGQLESLKQKLY